jgi:hypothetical protein
MMGGAHAATAAPTIASNQPDYAPGATVTLTGTNWSSGEAVHIVVNDTLGQTWQHDVVVNALSDGTVTDGFTLPNYFVANYDVTATGPISGTATTTFTDAVLPAGGTQLTKPVARSSRTGRPLATKRTRGSPGR